MARSLKRQSKREERRERITKIVVGLIIAFLMVTSIMGFVVNYNNPGPSQHVPTAVIDGYRFKLGDQGYTADINGRPVQFFNLPDQYPYLEVPQEAILAIKSAPTVGILFDPDQDVQYLQAIDMLRFSWMQNSGKNMGAGITKESEQFAFPVVRCQDASSATPIIYIKPANETSIDWIGSCLTVELQDFEFAPFHDVLLFELVK